MSEHPCQLAPPARTYDHPPGPTRNWLTVVDLIAGESSPPAPLNNRYFTQIGNSGSAVHPFSGSITLSTFHMGASMPGIDTMFPDIEFRFVTDGNALIPLDRDILVPRNESSWRLILNPGTVWSEVTDGEWSRASFPFSLVVQLWGGVLNGVGTFVYNASTISALRVQIVQETVGAPSPVDMWGTLAARYTPHRFPEHAAVGASFRQETAGYLPVRPWSDIERLACTTEAAFNNAPTGTTGITVAGIVKNAVIYRQSCTTRHGDYPYPQQMRLGAFSVAKSMGAAVALLRLAQKYGDGIGDLLIRDYVNITATHDGWNSVTFLDALNMCTGIGNANATKPTGTALYAFADEETKDLVQAVFSVPGAAAMLRQVFMQDKFSWGPGVEMRYNSTHTFVLSAAMDAYLKIKEGPTAQLWNMVAREVYAPIGVMYAPMLHSIEPDGSRGIPQLAMGWCPTVDDVAKIAGLLQSGGEASGQQLLSPRLLQTALYKTASQGLRAFSEYDGEFGGSRYLMSFWSVPWKDGSGDLAMVPYMLGAGGGLVVLSPNGAVAFRFAETGDIDPTPMIRATMNLGSLCER